MLPSQVQIAAGGIYGVSFLCEAAEHIAAQDDVWVKGVFTENDAGESFTNAAALTVVKVGLNTLQNHLPPYTRRVYGIHEEVQCNSLPALSEREWCCGGGTISYSGGVMTLTCSWHAYSGNVVAACNGAELKLPIRIVEPRRFAA